MHLHALDYVLWVSSSLVQGSVIYFLRKRGLASEFPIFYAYNIVQFTTDILLLCVESASYRAYFYAYWCVIAATVLLSFALVDELFRVGFRAYGALQTVGSQVLRWILLLTVLGACGLMFTLPSLRDSPSVGELILLADRCARIMLCLWSLLLIVGSPLMRISSRSMLFGIAVGVFIFGSSKIIVDTVFLNSHGGSALGSRINTAAYLAACLLWLFYAIHGESSPTYAVLPGAVDPSDPNVAEDEAKQPLMELINETVERYLRNPS